MKKTIITLFLAGSIGFHTGFINENKVIYYDDLNTKNFITRFTKEDIAKINEVCSYDYCDILRSEEPKRAMDIYLNRYLKTIDDMETKNSLKVKGIKITKIST